MRRFAFVLLVCAGCNGGGRTEAPVLPGAGGQADASGTAGGGGPGGADAGDLPDVVDAGSSPVLVGVTANAPDDGQPGTTVAEGVEAELTTFAAGARVVVATRWWAELDLAGLEALADKAAFYAEHDRKLLLELAVLDRAADGRPADLAPLAWDDPSVVAALDATIDGLYERVGPELVAVTFGREVDVWLAAHPGERDAFEVFAGHACMYARTHPLAPAGLRVGVGFSFAAAVAPDASFEELLGTSDLLVASYLPGEGGSSAPASAVVADMDALIARAQSKAIAVTALGTSSAAAAGGSPEAQEQFFAEFFQALEPRRSAFPIVNAFELHDLSQAECAVWADAQGESPEGELASFRCSLGVFGQDGVAKPAWLEVLEGAATFASP